jgi:hypothetical protein
LGGWEKNKENYGKANSLGCICNHTRGSLKVPNVTTHYGAGLGYSLMYGFDLLQNFRRWRLLW